MSAQPQTDQQRNRWQEYERRKRELPESLSADERDAELRRLADELGI